ncbi:MAG TPA: hypothetical protein VK569_09045, partial [Bacteroidota bacterium]|nr:hypothetical protein [Bacteroidota bacterium]
MKAFVIGGIILLTCLIVAALGAGLTAEERELLGKLPGEHPALIVTAAFLFLFAPVAAVLWVFRRYVDPLGKLADEAQVMNLVNPSHRLAVTGPAQMRQLSGIINRSLDRIQVLQSNVDEEIRVSRREVEEEKAILEALIHDFPDGVVVCNGEGQILLYNGRARELLTAGDGRGGPGVSAGPYVGLGRSVFAFIDREQILQALEMMDRTLKSGHERATARFVTGRPAGEPLNVEATPVTGGPAEHRGYILLLRDMSTRTERDARREALLHSLSERVSSSLATIRIGVEILVHHPAMEQSQRERLTLAIRDESFSLGGYLESRRVESVSGFRQARERQESRPEF